MKRKTAVVTGGSRGIGRAVAVEFAKAGCNLVINYAGNDEAAKETERLCSTEGAKVVLVKGDVADSTCAERIVEAALAEFGQIDILVNNAVITRDNILIRIEEEDFDKVIETNLKGTYLMMKACARHMIRKRSGRIINMASVVGIAGNAGQANYSASKAGVIGLTKSFAREVASRSITVNVVAPGFIDTDMTRDMTEQAKENAAKQIPAGRLGSAEEVAAAVLFLASDSAKYITGHVLNVDGGMCM